MDMDIVGFLEGKTPDQRGRMLSMLWNQTDDEAETIHDYIQWMFPLDEPSQAVNGAPVLNDLDIDEIREAGGENTIYVKPNASNIAREMKKVWEKRPQITLPNYLTWAESAEKIAIGLSNLT